MGNPIHSYKAMCYEADRLIREDNKIDANCSIEEIEKRLKEYKHDSLYYYNCGIAIANVKNHIKNINIYIIGGFIYGINSSNNR